MKHSPKIALAAARTAYSLAQEACPHWDYESGPAEHDCCYDLLEARRKYVKLLHAPVKLSQNNP